MSPLEQLIALSKDETDGKTITFASDEDYKRWLAERNNE